MLVRGQDDAEPRTGIDVDVRIDAALADELEPGQALEQGGADLGALADQHQGLGVFQARGQRIGVLDVVVPDRDFMAGQLAESIQSAQRVVIVVQYGYFHGFRECIPEYTGPGLPRAGRKHFLQPLANGARTPHISGIEFDLGQSAGSLRRRFWFLPRII